MNQGAIGDGLPAGCERPVTLGVLTDVVPHLPLAMSTVDRARVQFGTTSISAIHRDERLVHKAISPKARDAA
jgi:hypothetical protein